MLKYCVEQANTLAVLCRNDGAVHKYSGISVQNVAEKRACNALMMTSVFITALLINISIIIYNVINIRVMFNSLESVHFSPK